jgi:hypothetical protein
MCFGNGDGGHRELGHEFNSAICTTRAMTRRRPAADWCDVLIELVHGGAAGGLRLALNRSALEPEGRRVFQPRCKIIGHLLAGAGGGLGPHTPSQIRAITYEVGAVS